MKIIHLFANWKWTGPAEPALSTAALQSEQHDVLFASGAGKDDQDSKILPHARARGVNTVEGFHLSKHARVAANREDVRRLVGLLREFEPDIVHTHLDNDHRIASLAMRETGIGLLVRTAYDAEGLSGGFRTRRLARRRLDGLIVTTEHGREFTLETYGGAERSVSISGRPRPMVLIEPGIDLGRFDPSRFDRAAARRELGLEPEHVAVSIVARVQTHRRFDLLLDAVEQLRNMHPEFRLVVAGRGTNIERLLLKPVKERGLEDAVITPGYLEGDAYPRLLAAIDASVFLVPGSDGTCRALREQMAMGLPPLVTPRAPLPEIIEEGTAGFVVQETSDDLVRGIGRLITEPGLRARLGEGAAAVARARFDARLQAEKATLFYEQLLESASSSS